MQIHYPPQLPSPTNIFVDAVDTAKIMTIACGINCAAADNTNFWPPSIEAIIAFTVDTNAYQSIGAANDDAKFLAIT